jgi:hypothetical protein
MNTENTDDAGMHLTCAAFNPYLCSSVFSVVSLMSIVLSVLLRLTILHLLLSANPAAADPIRPQCWDCLRRLAMQLPEVNPQEDPTYEQGLTPGSVLPALAACSLDDNEVPVLQQVIQVFTDASVQGAGAAYVRQHLEQIPQVSADDRARLVDGARQDLDTTLRHLVDHNCRLLLRSHFDEGASRAWLLKMIALGRGPEQNAG